jgi:hypothetical protein
MMVGQGQKGVLEPSHKTCQESRYDDRGIQLFYSLPALHGKGTLSASHGMLQHRAEPMVWIVWETRWCFFRTILILV